MNRRRTATGTFAKVPKKLITKKEAGGYRCQICHKLYPALDALNRHHRNTHKVKLPRYQCSYCKRIYNNFECKLLHEKEKHPDKKKKVPVPAPAPPPAPAPAAQPTLKCSYCPSTFTAALSKKMHELSMHSGKNSYACDLCPSSFNKKRSLEWHQFTLHMSRTPRPSEAASKPKPSEAASKPNKAKAAAGPGKKKMTKQGLKKQTVKARTPNGVEMVYATELCCDYCPTFFSTSSAKEKHERRHIGDLPYTCEMCSASFYRQDLVTHHETECPQLPYTTWCKFCDYNTLERVNLERHYIRHHGFEFQSKEELEFYRKEVLTCGETEPEPDLEAEPADLDSELHAPTYVDVETPNEDDEVLSNFDDEPSDESEDEFQDAFQESPILESSSVYFEDADIANDEELIVPTDNNERSLHSGVSEINRKLHHKSHQDSDYTMQIDRLEEIYRDDHSDPLDTSTNSPESILPGKVTIVKVPMKIERPKIERPICQNEVSESNDELTDVLRDESSEQSAAEECPEQHNEPHQDTDNKTEIKYSQILAESIEKQTPIEKEALIDPKMIKYEVEVAQLNCNLKGIFHNEEGSENGVTITSDPEVEQSVDLTSEEVQAQSPIIVIDDDD